MIGANGLLIESVATGGAAEKAGIKQGDYLIKYGDEDIATHDQINDAIQKNNTETTVVVVRSGEQLELTIQSGKLGAVLKPSFVLGNGLSSAKVQSDSNSLINILNLVAWLALILGLIAALVTFNSIGYVQIGRSSQLNPVGFMASFVIAFQGFFAFALLRVIATMALDVKGIKKKLEL